MMNPSRQKEEFSNAFVQAIASTAGFGSSKPSVDDDSIDWTIAQRGGAGIYRSPRLELQLKSTSTATVSDGIIAYPLKLKNYEDLRASNCLVPRILVLVLLPERVEDWLVVTDGELILRRCAYWLSLCDMPETDNKKTVTVHIPTAQRFDCENLQKMMETISRREKL